MLNCIINYIIQFIDNNCDFVTLIVACITCMVTIYIPRRIRIDQEFSGLAAQYRSAEMGFAVLSLFHFYEHDCHNNPDLIEPKYIERYNKEVNTQLLEPQKSFDPALTLQFQRRLVAYFYWDLAKLYFDSKFPRLTKKQLTQFVEANERNLISLVLQMSEANRECFAKTENISAPPDDESPMNQLIKQLYDTTEDFI